MPKSKPPSKKIKFVERPLGREKALGQAWNHDAFDKQPIIEIDPRQPPKEYMDTFIHETLHCADPYMTEEEVNRIANFISYHMWKYGFRRVYGAGKA